MIDRLYSPRKDLEPCQTRKIHNCESYLSIPLRDGGRVTRRNELPSTSLMTSTLLTLLGGVQTTLFGRSELPDSAY